MKIKNTFPKTGPLTLEKLWKAGLAVGALLLAVIIALDIWIYISFTDGNSLEAPAEVKGFPLLNEKTLKTVEEKIKAREEGLRNATFPTVNNPF
ncbi:hypothetical protein HYT01_01540 [Candidatus Giovannonibacteria bacterium]|nr:hypothetical protein [Candidatus Giovannonibacteria bacterium]